MVKQQSRALVFILMFGVLFAGCSSREQTSVVGKATINKSTAIITHESDIGQLILGTDWYGSWKEIRQEFESQGFSSQWIDASHSSKLPRHIQRRDGVVFFASLEHVQRLSSVYVLTDPLGDKVVSVVFWNWPKQGISTTLEIDE